MKPTPEYLYELREVHLSRARLRHNEANAAAKDPTLTPRLRQAYRAFYLAQYDQEVDLSELCGKEARNCYAPESTE